MREIEVHIPLFISLKRLKMGLQRANDLIYVHSNLYHLSRTYKENYKKERKISVGRNTTLKTNFQAKIWRRPIQAHAR